MLVKLNHFSNFRAKNKKCLKPPLIFQADGDKNTPVLWCQWELLSLLHELHVLAASCCRMPSNNKSTRRARHLRNKFYENPDWIWPNGIIFHQPWIFFSKCSKGFPLLFATFWRQNGRVRLLWFDQIRSILWLWGSDHGFYDKDLLVGQFLDTTTWWRKWWWDPTRW